MINVTYTFVNTPTGAENEIVIGPDAATTAANIAAAINNTYGAVFVATSAAAVVSVTDYTSDTITKSASGSGLSLSAVTKSITYTSSLASSTIPSFEAAASGTVWGDLGDTYVMSTIAPLTATGTSTMTGINASILMPSFRASAQSFITGKNSSSTDAEITSLLKCGDTWMESFAAMVVVPGDPDDVALVATQWVASNITYASDLATWGVADYWLDPRATLYYGVGDCEDGAFLTASIIINSGVDSSRVRVYIGETYGVGHAWCMYQRMSDNQWVVMDWLEGSAYWTTISDVNELTPLYDSIVLLESLAVNAADLVIMQDAAPYGKGTSYVVCAGVVDLVGEEYSESLYANPMVPTMVGVLPAIKGGVARLTIYGDYESVSGIGGGELTKKIPSITLSASAQGDRVANLTKAIARIGISAAAHTDTNGTLSKAIPSIRLSATGVLSPVSSLSRPIPAIRLTAAAISGMTASLAKSIPTLGLDASAYWMKGATLEEAIPAIRLNSYIRAHEVIALALNTNNMALTKYTNFDYNSLCNFNGKLIGAKRGGIYELEGPTDHGTAIPWKLRLGKLDLGTRKLRHILVTGATSGDMTLVVELPDGTKYEYIGEPVSSDEDGIKIKVGKGIRSRYLTLELYNESDETITIDRVSVFGKPGQVT
jgi:predicted transglutaminase-like cysteine proteinase